MYKKSKILKELRSRLTKGQRITPALKDMRISHLTIRAWSVRPMIASYIESIKNIRQNRIDNAVEDKFIDRLLKGEANTADYIFYLCNMKSGKWKNKIEHSGKIEGQETKIIIIRDGNKTETVPRQIRVQQGEISGDGIELGHREEHVRNLAGNDILRVNTE